MNFLVAALFALNGLVALASGLPPGGGMSALADTGELELSAFENKLLRGVHANTDMLWLDRARIRFRVFGPSSFNTALQLVLRPHFFVHFV
jgi:hypothetical protein